MRNRWWNRIRFDAYELFVVATFVGYVAYEWPRSPSEAVQLRRVYGPSQYSAGPEETIIRDFFKDKRAGFFVDVGAADYKKDSNTFYLERSLGWSGIAVDALSGYASGYAQHRPGTRFFARFVSDVSDSEATVFAQLDTRQTAEWRRPTYGPSIEVHVRTITLTQLLTEQRVSHIDLLSVDVELAEPRVLAGFDIERFRPSLVCIEAFSPVRQHVLDYFVRHRYVVVGKYLRADERNLYFTPFS